MLPKATSGTSISGFVSANHSTDALWTGSWVAHGASVLLPFSQSQRVLTLGTGRRTPRGQPNFLSIMRPRCDWLKPNAASKVAVAFPGQLRDINFRFRTYCGQPHFLSYASALWLAEPQQSGRPVDSRLGEGTSRCQTVCPLAVRWADALGAVPGLPWDGIWHTGDVIGHTRDVLGRPVDGRIVPRTSTGQWTHYGRSRRGTMGHDNNAAFCNAIVLHTWRICM